MSTSARSARTVLPPSERPMTSRLLLPVWGPAIVFVALLLVAWEFLVRASGIKPYILPAPSAVGAAIYRDLVGGAIVTNGWVTLVEVLLGFAGGSVAGLVLGVLVTQFRIVERIVYPLLVIFQSMPRIALAPLLIIWIGFGLESKAIIAGLTAFFPMMVNVIIGRKSVEPERVELMAALAASRWQSLVMVGIPSALPSIFGGLELAIIFSVVGAVVGEFTGAKAGLGFLIESRTYSLDVAGIFSMLVSVAILGLALDSAVKFVGSRVVFWQKRRDLTGI